MHDEILIELAEEVFGVDASEGETFESLRDRYVDQLGEELEEELRRDVEAMKGEDEGDFIDAREPPEPFCSPLDEPFRPARALNAVTSKRDRG